jgi:hypothetical protein
MRAVFLRRDRLGRGDALERAQRRDGLVDLLALIISGGAIRTTVP